MTSRISTRKLPIFQCRKLRVWWSYLYLYCSTCTCWALWRCSNCSCSIPSRCMVDTNIWCRDELDSGYFHNGSAIAFLSFLDIASVPPSIVLVCIVGDLGRLPKRVVIDLILHFRCCFSHHRSMMDLGAANAGCWWEAVSFPSCWVSWFTYCLDLATVEGCACSAAYCHALMDACNMQDGTTISFCHRHGARNFSISWPARSPPTIPQLNKKMLRQHHK